MPVKTAMFFVMTTSLVFFVGYSETNKKICSYRPGQKDLGDSRYVWLPVQFEKAKHSLP